MTARSPIGQSPGGQLNKDVRQLLRLRKEWRMAGVRFVDLGLVVRRDLISRIDELSLGERSYGEAAVAILCMPAGFPQRERVVSVGVTNGWAGSSGESKF